MTNPTRAVVTQEFNGRPDNEEHVRKIEVDEVISGDLADIAIADGNAEKISDDDFEAYQEHEREEQAAAEAAGEGAPTEPAAKGGKKRR